VSSKEHKKKSPRNISIGILTISTSRTLQTDESGRWMSRMAKKEGHRIVCHQVIPDDSGVIVNTVLSTLRDPGPEVLLLTGGTGIARQDVTIEAVRPLLEKELTAFGTVFSQLSFEEIDSAAILSRATAGVIGQTAVFCLPGSLSACKLACKALIFPELGHIVKHIREDGNVSNNAAHPKE